MSARGSGVSQTLQAPGEFETKSVPASGDCFYDAMHLLLPTTERPPELYDATVMRDTVANSLTEETFALYKMFASAGVDDFSWLSTHRAPTTIDELKAFARKRGRDAGAGHCLWADEGAMQLISAAAGVCLLIIDEQAASVGSRSGRRRGGAQQQQAVDGRFVMVGEPRPRCVLIHRSRRQHFTPCFFRGRGVIEAAELPSQTRALWPKLRDVASAAAAAAAAASASAAASAAAATSTSASAAAAGPVSSSSSVAAQDEEAQELPSKRQRATGDDGITVPWACDQCTLEHAGLKALFLACAVCGHPRSA